MILAAGGLPRWTVVLATMVGGTLAAGSANALNCYVDRDIDVLMHRTERRPLVTGEVSPREALLFGLALGVVAAMRPSDATVRTTPKTSADRGVISPMGSGRRSVRCMSWSMSRST